MKVLTCGVEEPTNRKRGSLDPSTNEESKKPRAENLNTRKRRQLQPKTVLHTRARTLTVFGVVIELVTNKW